MLFLCYSLARRSGWEEQYAGHCPSVWHNCRHSHNFWQIHVVDLRRESAFWSGCFTASPCSSAWPASLRAQRQSVVARGLPRGPAIRGRQAVRRHRGPSRQAAVASRDPGCDQTTATSVAPRQSNRGANTRKRRRVVRHTQDTRGSSCTQQQPLGAQALAGEAVRLLCRPASPGERGKRGQSQAIVSCRQGGAGGCRGFGRRVRACPSRAHCKPTLRLGVMQSTVPGRRHGRCSGRLPGRPHRERPQQCLYEWS